MEQLQGNFFNCYNNSPDFTHGEDKFCWLTQVEF